MVSILKGVSSACSHLHSKKINHGDLYAHNILIADNGYALLSDFGAASNYNFLSSSLGMNIQLLEVRAFGCLVEDLLHHLELKEGCQIPINILEDLRRDTMNEEIAVRPTFNNIFNRLKQIPII